MYINVIHHINKRKFKRHLVFSIDTQEAFDKLQCPVMIKSLTKVGIQGTYPDIKKADYDKLTAIIILYVEKLKAFLLKSGQDKDAHLFQHNIGSISHSDQA